TTYKRVTVKGAGSTVTGTGFKVSDTGQSPIFQVKDGAVANLDGGTIENSDPIWRSNTVLDVSGAGARITGRNLHINMTMSTTDDHIPSANLRHIVAAGTGGSIVLHDSILTGHNANKAAYDNAHHAMYGLFVQTSGASSSIETHNVDLTIEGKGQGARTWSRN